MKSNLKVNLVLICCAVASFLFKYYWHFPFFGGSCFGASIMLMVLNYFGQRQLNRGIKRVDKLMKDKIVSIEEQKNYIDE